MGYFFDGYCHADLSTAEKIWCAGVTPGSTFSSCQIVAGAPEISYHNGSTIQTTIYHPPLGACDPSTDNINLLAGAPLLIAAAVGVLAVAWGFRRTVDLLRGPNE